MPPCRAVKAGLSIPLPAQWAAKPGKKRHSANPSSQAAGFFFVHQGITYYQLGMLGEAVTAFKKALALEPNGLISHAWLAACYSEMGKEDEARSEVATLLKLSPNFFLAYRAKTAPYKIKADLDRHLNALARAGLK